MGKEQAAHHQGTVAVDIGERPQHRLGYSDGQASDADHLEACRGAERDLGQPAPAQDALGCRP